MGHVLRILSLPVSIKSGFVSPDTGRTYAISLSWSTLHHAKVLERSMTTGGSATSWRSRRLVRFSDEERKHQRWFLLGRLDGRVNVSARPLSSLHSHHNAVAHCCSCKMYLGVVGLRRWYRAPFTQLPIATSIPIPSSPSCSRDVFL